MSWLKQPRLDVDGFARKTYSEVNGILPLTQRVFNRLRPGKNASNTLDRGIIWGVYAKGDFHWMNRTSYSLPASKNSEEAGRVRHFQLLPREFVSNQVVEAVLRDNFQAWNFEEDSYQRAYEVQISAIQYRATLDTTAIPSPVYKHQDLVDGTILVLNTEGEYEGGTTRVFDLQGEPLYECLLSSGEALLIRDEKVLHQVTPISVPYGSKLEYATRSIIIIRFQAVGR